MKNADKLVANGRLMSLTGNTLPIHRKFAVDRAGWQPETKKIFLWFLKLYIGTGTCCKLITKFIL